MKAGLAVPAGFCISRCAYESHLALCAPHWRDLVEGRDFAKLQAAILKCDLEPSLSQSVCTAATEHLPRHLRAAVRSSSTAEDLVGFSSAGVYRSELQVHVPDELDAAIRRCWAAYWSEEAVSYRERVGLSHESNGMAVLVQAMVEARYAGVVFTTDPVSGSSDRIVVEVGEGVADGLVDGTSRPQMVRLSRSLERLSGPVKNGIARAAEAAAKVAIECERNEGAPQDVEWAIDAKGNSYLIQTRPISTCAPREGGQRVSTVDWQLVYEEPFSPFGCELAEKRFRRWCAALSRYYRLRVKPEMVAQDGLIRYRPVWRHPRIGNRLHRRLMSVVRCLQSGAIHARYTNSLPQAKERLAELSTAAELAAGERELWTCLQDAIDCYLDQQVSSYAIGKVAADEAAALERLCRRWLPPAERVSALDLLAGESNTTSDREIALGRLRERFQAASRRSFRTWADVEQFLESSSEARRLKGELRAFEEKYGYVWADRYPRDPAWQLDRDAEIAALSTKVSDDRPQLEAGVERIRERRKRAMAQCRASLGRGWKRWVFEALLNRVKRDFPHREERNEIVYQGASVVRLVMRRLGEKLVERGLLDNLDDIFFLQFKELEELAERREPSSSISQLIASRRSGYEHAREVCRRPGTTRREHIGMGYQAPLDLKGEGCSPGGAAGPARVISGLGEFQRVTQGDIVVCKQLRPAWTTIFSRIGGAVIEQGGVLSHGSILAREYRLPVVINVPRLCDQVKEGDWLIIDGTKGTVHCLPHPPAGLRPTMEPVHE